MRLGTGLSWTPLGGEIGTPPDVRAGFPANSIAGCWWGCQATRDWLGSKLLLVGSILMPYRCNPGLVAIDLSAMISGQGHHTSNPPVLVSPLPRNMLPRLHGVACPIYMPEALDLARWGCLSERFQPLRLLAGVGFSASER